MHTSKLLQTSENQNSGSMSQKQAEAIAELKRFYPDLPKDLVIEGNLNLADKVIKMLPDGLHIKGSLDIRGCCFIDELPADLNIAGNFYQADCELPLPVSMKVGGQIDGVDGEQLPENFFVGGDLIIGDYSETLPENLTVGGSLDLSKTKIDELPRGLKVLGNLTIRDRQIKSLPEDLWIGGNLDCYNSAITSIPQTVHIGGGLHIGSTKIRSLPKHMKNINGDLCISNSPVKYLPDGLTVLGSLWAYSSNLQELPENLTVHGYLDIQNTEVDTWPEKIYVERGIDLSGCPITSLPDGLQVNGSLDLRKTPIKTLPDNLIVNESLYISNTKITSLPSFVNAGCLHIAPGGALHSLPDEFSVAGGLNLYSYSKEPEAPIGMPINLKVGGDLTIGNTLIESLPDNCFIGGDLYFGFTSMKALPTNINLQGTLIITSEVKNEYEIVIGLVTSRDLLPYTVLTSKRWVDEALKFLPDLVRDKSIHDRIKPVEKSPNQVNILPHPSMAKKERVSEETIKVKAYKKHLVTTEA